MDSSDLWQACIPPVVTVSKNVTNYGKPDFTKIPQCYDYICENKFIKELVLLLLQ